MNSKATRARFSAFSTELLTVVPGPQRGARAERIGAGAAERVPVGDAEAQVVLHRVAFDLFVLVVVAEGERVLRRWDLRSGCGRFREMRPWEVSPVASGGKERIKRAQRHGADRVAHDECHAERTRKVHILSDETTLREGFCWTVLQGTSRLEEMCGQVLAGSCNSLGLEQMTGIYWIFGGDGRGGDVVFAARQVAHCVDLACDSWSATHRAVAVVVLPCSFAEASRRRSFGFNTAKEMSTFGCITLPRRSVLPIS